MQIELHAIIFIERVEIRIREEQPEGIFAGLAGPKIGLNPFGPGGMKGLFPGFLTFVFRPVHLLQVGGGAYREEKQRLRLAEGIEIEGLFENALGLADLLEMHVLHPRTI